MTETVWLRSSRLRASVEPTRPQPMITTCTGEPYPVRSWVSATSPSGSCSAASSAAPSWARRCCPSASPSRLRQRRALLGRLRPRRDLHHAVAGRRVGVRLVVEDRHRRRAGDARPWWRRTARPCTPTPVGRRRLRGRHGQPRPRPPASRSPARCSSTTCSPSRCRSRRARSTPPRRSRALSGHEATFATVAGGPAGGDEPARHPRVRARSSRSRPTPSWSPSSACAPTGCCSWPPATCPRSRAPTSTIAPAPGYDGLADDVALLFLLARAFSSGCAALTGVEAISNGVPAFRKPKSQNAATTLLLLGADRDHDDAEHHRAGQRRWA